MHLDCTSPLTDPRLIDAIDDLDRAACILDYVINARCAMKRYEPGEDWILSGVAKDITRALAALKDALDTDSDN